MAPPPTPTPSPKPAAAGKPGGLPIWAWGAAAALGLVLGLFFLRGRDATADSSSSDAPTKASEEEGAGGGVVALPPELLEALGLRGYGGAADGGGSDPGGGGSDPGGAQTTASAWDGYAAGGQQNRQLPARLQLAGLAPTAPVISSYFEQPQTIRGPASLPSLATVKQVAPPDLRGAGTRSFQPA